uniref:BRCT domain-containing protein n=1 Tax=Sinocyclocheilus grahami TaxID=75366 RepID=A0A672LWU0_SINGR
MIPLKRRKVSLPVNSQHNDTCKFPNVSIIHLGEEDFLLKKPTRTNYHHFSTTVLFCRGANFCLFFSYSSYITHVVSENNSKDEVQAWLDNQTGRDASSSVHLLDTRWFSESVEAGHPVIVQDRHILKVQGQISLRLHDMAAAATTILQRE